ncbi:MAG TPA: protoporphyrinogen oxidase [Blastocatellia bacterium]|nr:protoporphyrinogen oxidase [Blastocatellia bacterium]
MNRSVCIIGGGISGLTAGLLLKKKGFEVRLFERSDEVGGNIKSMSADGFLMEKGPNSLMKSPRLVDLIDLLDLRGEVMAANPSAKKRLVLQNGRLKPLPMGLKDFVLGDFFTRGAKFRLLREPFIRSKASGDESVADFFARRLGQEVVERAVDPFISGIYAGDPSKLSIEAAFPKLFTMERDYGSLLWGALRQKSERADASFPRMFSFRGGLRCLPDAIAADLGESITKGCGVKAVTRKPEGGFAVNFDAMESAEFDAVIISSPAAAASAMIDDMDSGLAGVLRSIAYSPVAVVHSGFRHDQVGFAPDGFGFLVPGGENRKILGSLWNSTVFDDRAPAGYHLFTTFVGGSRTSEALDQSDDEITETVLGELGGIMNLKGEPVFTQITRWTRAIPQYHIGYSSVTRRIADFEKINKGIFFCGNFYGGISIGDCVKNAYAIADKAAETLGNK